MLIINIMLLLILSIITILIINNCQVQKWYGIDIGVFTYNTIWNGISNNPIKTKSNDGTKCILNDVNLCQKGMIEEIHKYFNREDTQFICLQECPTYLYEKILEGYDKKWKSVIHKKGKGMMIFYKIQSSLSYHANLSINGFLVNDNKHGERPYMIEVFTIKGKKLILINIHAGHPGFGDYTYFNKVIWNDINSNPYLHKLWLSHNVMKIIAGDWNTPLYNKNLFFGGIKFIGANKKNQKTCCASGKKWPQIFSHPNSSFDNILCSNNMEVINRIVDKSTMTPFKSDHLGVFGISRFIYSY